MAQWQVGDETGFVDQVPYAERLADGWSPQASAGWLDLIAEEVAQSGQK
jgi:hypothetical protein